MLKAGSVKSKSAGGGEAWPSRPVKPSPMSASQSHDSRDTEEYEHVPSYETSFSDAIQAALDSYDQTTGEYWYSGD